MWSSIRRLSTIGRDFFGGVSMLSLKPLGTLFSLVSYPRSIKRRFIRPVLLYLAGFCVALNTAQAAVVLPVIDRPTPWEISMCLNSRYSPNAGYWARWCGIVKKGVWSSRGHGLSSCTNTSPVTEQNMVARLRHFATFMYGDRNCETRATWTGWMAPGGRIDSDVCWTLPYTEKNGIEVLNGGWIYPNGTNGDNCAGSWGRTYMVRRDRKVVPGCPNGYERSGKQCIGNSD